MYLTRLLRNLILLLEIRIYDREREINESISKPFAMIGTSMTSEDGRMKLSRWIVAQAPDKRLNEKGEQTDSELKQLGS